MRTYTCTACKRTFESTPGDIEEAGGHLCIAMDKGLSQHEALEQLKMWGSIGAEA